MRFSDISGHTAIKNQWQEAIESNKIPHAMLLVGQEGVGKRALLLAFVQRMFCREGNGLHSCGECKQCKKVENLSHPDFNFSFPITDSKSTSSDYSSLFRDSLKKNPFIGLQEWLQILDSKNKQGNISSGEVAHIIKTLQMHSYEGGIKIHFIWMAEFLGKESNKLLKLIEEPPKNTYIFLIASSEEDILPTILSRCQVFYVPPFKDSEVLSMLHDQYAEKLESDQMVEISRTCDGSMTQAIEMVNGNYVVFGEKFINWLRDIYIGNGADLVDNAAELNKMSRSEQKYFIEYGLNFIRQLPYFSLNIDNLALLTMMEAKSAQKLSQIIDQMHISKMMEVLNQALYSLERNAHPKLVFLVSGMRLHKIINPKAQ